MCPVMTSAIDLCEISTKPYGDSRGLESQCLLCGAVAIKDRPRVLMSHDTELLNHKSIHVEGCEMSSADIIAQVNKAIANEFEIDMERMVPEADLMKDLELDSLDSVDLIAAMEKTFKVKCPEAEARKLRTLGEVHVFVQRLLSEHAAA
jgi:acyl carrier protein